jgi:branched-chain amino acid transport system substrate-binding protein
MYGDDKAFKFGSAFTGTAYDATMLIGLAIEAAGSTDRAKISAALRKVASAPGEKIGPGEFAKAKELLAAGKDIDYEGATGSHEFDENGDVKGLYARYEVKDDQLVDSGVLKY